MVPIAGSFTSHRKLGMKILMSSESMMKVTKLNEKITYINTIKER